MIKNIAKLKIPILVLPEMYVTNPTTRGPNNAANFPSMLYIPKYSQSLPYLGPFSLFPKNVSLD